jgi:thiamine biosynthesis lipoprotein
MSTVIEHEHSFDLFGTRVRLLVAAPAATPLEARIAALRVQARLTRLHQALTRFEPESELSRLNQRAGATVAVSPTMSEAIAAALYAAQISDGLVDPTLLPQLEQAGYAQSRVGLAPADLATAVAAAPERRSARAHPASVWRNIELDAAAGTLRVPAGVRLDLGGSAKGMAVDIAARMLAHSSAFAVDAGGDIRLGGTDPSPRSVRIEHPLTGETAHELVRTSAAIATSGVRTRVWRTAEGYAHHLIDPSRGTPAWTGVIQASALAPTALEAETLAKAALLLGPDHGHALLARRGGALVLDDGEFVLAGRLQHDAGHAPALTR